MYLCMLITLVMSGPLRPSQSPEDCLDGFSQTAALPTGAERSMTPSVSTALQTAGVREPCHRQSLDHIISHPAHKSDLRLLALIGQSGARRSADAVIGRSAADVTAGENILGRMLRTERLERLVLKRNPMFGTLQRHIKETLWITDMLHVSCSMCMMMVMPFARIQGFARCVSAVRPPVFQHSGLKPLSEGCSHFYRVLFQSTIWHNKATMRAKRESEGQRERAKSKEREMLGGTWQSPFATSSLLRLPRNPQCHLYPCGVRENPCQCQRRQNPRQRPGAPAQTHTAKGGREAILTEILHEKLRWLGWHMRCGLNLVDSHFAGN
ncbi:hypothetical protein QQF64_022646 [Cirrhinus molitorella]|uniref:Uncharacterized protein n=1 Tax=Cirrhinus molitorella TaxID=172907 RepID=A0ABR3L4D8_9TELE